jgi:hypothetical protein
MSRRLAAVMFTDLAGATAMAKADEADALRSNLSVKRASSDDRKVGGRARRGVLSPGWMRTVLTLQFVTSSFK